MAATKPAKSQEQAQADWDRRALVRTGPKRSWTLSVLNTVARLDFRPFAIETGLPLLTIDTSKGYLYGTPSLQYFSVVQLPLEKSQKHPLKYVNRTWLPDLTPRPS